MKFTTLSTSAMTLALASTIASAAVQPAATPAAVLQERQGSVGIDPSLLSEYVSDRTEALEQFSKALQDPQYSSLARSVITQSSAYALVSSAFEAQYGKESASQQLESYSQAINSLFDIDGGNSDKGSSSSGDHDGKNAAASSFVSVGMAGSAMVAGAVFVVAML